MKKNRSNVALVGIMLSGMAMSVGWGFRGDYGHEAGAMVSGALLGLAICLASSRQDWWHRSTIMAMCGAVGWAFGGQMSYGMIIGLHGKLFTAGYCLWLRLPVPDRGIMGRNWFGHTLAERDSIPLIPGEIRGPSGGVVARMVCYGHQRFDRVACGNLVSE